MSERGPVAQLLALELAFSFDNALRLVQAMLADPAYGDVPSATIAAFMRRCADPAEGRQLLERIEQLRRAHFAALGEPLPERSE